MPFTIVDQIDYIPCDAVVSAKDGNGRKDSAAQIIPNMDYKPLPDHDYIGTIAPDMFTLKRANPRNCRYTIQTSWPQQAERLGGGSDHPALL